jgi:hypothetical protein
MNLVDRVKNILLQPKQEWAVVETETTDTKTLYTSYAMILAAIPAVAGFIGASIIGYGTVFGVSVRIPIAQGIAGAVVGYALSLGGVYVLALIIDALAPNFNGSKNMNQALKLAVYSSTASWMAGIFSLIPGLGILGLLGLYSLYLLFLGLPVLMTAPEDKAVAYTAVTVVCALVISVVIGAITAGIMAGGARF